MFKAPYGLNFTTILDFLSVNENKNKQTNKQTNKTGRCLEVILAVWAAL